MVILYIRHGEDKRASHKYDEKLTSEGKKEIKQFTLSLLEENGVPDIIYYSPYYRTRQTRKQMMKVIEEFADKEVELKVEPRLGRYFTSKQKKNPDVKRSTLHKGAIIDETWNEFKERVEEQLDDVLKNDYANIWNITHTLVVLRVAKIKNIERDSHVEYLDTIKIIS